MNIGTLNDLVALCGEQRIDRALEEIRSMVREGGDLREVVLRVSGDICHENGLGVVEAFDLATVLREVLAEIRPE